MKRSLFILFVAAPALAFNAYTFQNLYCHRAPEQIPVIHSVNQYGTPDATDEFAEVGAALTTWSNVSGQWFRAERGANTPVINYGNDGVNLVVWYEPEYKAYGQNGWPWGMSAVAVATFWLSNQGSYYKVTEFDLCLNGDGILWSDHGEPDRYDIQNMCANQFGHSLVLDAVYGAGYEECTMYGYTALGETKKRTLEPDDEAGIRFLYGYVGVAVEKFTATAREGAVELAWRLATEESVAGYNLYRRVNDGRDNDYTKVNGALITGRAPYTYRDEAVAAGTAYQYLLEVVELTGTKEQFGPVGVELRGGGKYAFGLAQSYPNPARERATIKYTLATAGEATLAVYDLTGRRVTTLASGNRPAGEHEVVWPLVGTDGARVPAGVYIYRLEAAGDAATRRLVVSP